MDDWKSDPNKRALAIVRRSSSGQQENTSGDTQDREMRGYVERLGLELILVDSIIETAYKSDNRKKYNALMKQALSQGIKHVLFYIGSREARNLTDNETNERLIKEDKLIIHHVSDGKVYWKGSSDSDFLSRDLLVAVNKNSSRENGTKMKAAYKTKAENGCWPYRHTPMGYLHSKDKDKYGNPIKGTAKLIINPDPRFVKLVQREFELRAQEYSIDQIRKKTLEEKLVPAERSKTYSLRGIDNRLRHPLYRGYFFLTGSPVKYPGKHALFIPEKIHRAVDAVNNGRACKRKSIENGANVFSGWLVCGHPDCQRAVTYDPKKKKLKGTGEEVIYHYYRCSNSRRVHETVRNISEKKIWNQFEPAVDALAISKEFAKDIAAALNETHEKQKAAIRKQMEGFKLELKNLEGQEDDVYADRKRGILDDAGYHRQIKRVRDDRAHFTREIESLTLAISDEAMVSVQKVFELAINAKSLWKSMERDDRLEYLKKVCSNQTLDELTVHYQLQKPFARLASMKQNSEWRTRRLFNNFKGLTFDSDRTQTRLCDIG